MISTQQGAKKRDAQKDQDAHASELNWRRCAGARCKTASNHIVDNDLADAPNPHRGRQTRQTCGANSPRCRPHCEEQQLLQEPDERRDSIGCRLSPHQPRASLCQDAESQRMLTREYLKCSADGPLHSNRHLPHIFTLTTITKSPIWASLQHLANLGAGLAKRLMLLWMYPGMRSKSWSDWQVSHRATHIAFRNMVFATSAWTFRRSKQLMDNTLKAAHFGNPTNSAEFRDQLWACLLYTSPSPRDATLSRMPSSA